MDIGSAILLGLAEGAGFILPISDNGLTAILVKILAVDLTEHEMLRLLCSVAILAALALCCRKEFSPFLQSFRQPLSSNRMRQRDGLSRRTAIFALLVAAVQLIPLAIKQVFLFRQVSLIAVFVACAASGFLCFAASRRQGRRKDERELVLADVLVIAAAAAVGTVPGCSVVGFAICTAVLLGYTAEFAMRFVLLLLLPSQVLNILFAAISVLRCGVTWSLFGIYALGALAAFLAAAGAITALRKIFLCGSFGGFAFFHWGVGVLALFFALIS